MSVRFDHLAVAPEDKRQSARFLTNLLGLPDPSASGPFLSVTLDDGASGSTTPSPASRSPASTTRCSSQTMSSITRWNASRPTAGRAPT